MICVIQPAATRLAGKMQLALVGQVLGHSDPKTTQRYVNATSQTVSQAAMILEQWQDEQKLILNPEQRQISQEIIH
jgi:hypothetical protein